MIVSIPSRESKQVASQTTCSLKSISAPAMAGEGLHALNKQSTSRSPAFRQMILFKKNNNANAGRATDDDHHKNGDSLQLIRIGVRL